MRLLIKNISPLTTKSDLLELFKEYGEISDVYMVKETIHRRHRGLAFIGYYNEPDGLSALTYANNMVFMKFRIKVEKANDQNLQNKTSRNKSSKFLIEGIPIRATLQNLKHCLKGITKEITFDTKNSINTGRCLVTVSSKSEPSLFALNDLLGRRIRITRLTQTESNSPKLANGYFFNFSNILTSISNQFKINKASLINSTDSDKLGSKIALLESKLVYETKQWLEFHNVYLDGIITGVNKKRLLVRNYDLINSGKLSNAKISPTKLMAILDFDTESEARSKLIELNYLRYNGSIVYCDYLPYTAPKSTSSNLNNNVVLIKNFPFQADENDLMELINPIVKVVKIRIPSVNEDREINHRGFAFLELQTVNDVERVIAYFGTSTHLYGRRLVFLPAESTNKE